MKLIRMEGDVFFGAVPHVADKLRELHSHAGAPRHLLVMAKRMNSNDLAAVELWRTEMAVRRASGGDLYFHHPRQPVLELWQHVGFTRELGADHIFPSKRVALHAIFGRLDRRICAHCKVRVFDECQALPPPLS